VRGRTLGILSAILTGLTLLGFVAYGVMVEPNRLVLREVYVKDDLLQAALGGKSVVQLSDLHIDTARHKLNTILITLARLKPDFLFLTGDYVKRAENYKGALSFFSLLSAQTGVWAVMGDYDYRMPRKSCLFCHEPNSGRPTNRHDVKFLRNSIVSIGAHHGSSIYLAGIDDGSGQAALSKENPLHLLEGKEPVIVLSHSPLIFDLLDANQDVLVLAGDTHGGQIPLPSWVWRILGYEKNAKYRQGWFEDGKKKMYVSSGIGTSHFPIRFCRPPEITVFRFIVSEPK
jgi:uncharacterized protein